jgi:peptidoglycan hydrolase-like protein with peptidoglycan-binding domain
MKEIQGRGSTGELVAASSPEGGDVPRRRSRFVVAGIGILAAGAAIGWAATTVLTPPRDVLDSTAYTFVEVVDGEVGSSIRLNTVAAWTPILIGSNQARGVVTSVDVAVGQQIDQGSVLYTVNLRPVVVARGDVPAFRALAAGASGADVSQLQTFLTELGYFTGTVDGRFGPGTGRAVKAWQKAIGLEPDGIVQLGDLVFVPSLPTRVSLDTEVLARGSSVSGGEDVVNGLAAEPSFTVPVTDAQAQQMPVGTRVEMAAPGGQTWQGFVVDQAPAEDGSTVSVVLGGADGASICGDGCDDIPVTGGSLLPSQIITIETEDGLVVPTAALRSDATGRLSVIDDAGEVHAVTVVASARGMAVITGVERGTMVRVPGDGN